MKDRNTGCFPGWFVRALDRLYWRHEDRALLRREDLRESLEQMRLGLLAPALTLEEEKNDKITEAITLLRKRAQMADTGESWEADKHYDALWIVDLKPAPGIVPDGTYWGDVGLGRQDVAGYEQPRFLLALHEIAVYIASMQPAVGLALAELLEQAPEDAARKFARAYLGSADA